MTEAAPSPLVPPEVDLRDFGFMPLDVRRLLTSETWIEASEDPRLGHALICLWSESWHQVPAASLPDNDRVLQRLSMCPTAKEWNRVKARALSGWVKCSDGLLYHPVVAEKALDSWSKKLAQRERTKAATEARERKRRERDDQRHDERNEQRNVEREQQRDVHQGRVKGQGEGDIKALSSASGSNPVAPAPAAAPPATSENQGQKQEPPGETSRGVQVSILLRKHGVSITSMHPLAEEWGKTGLTDAQFLEAVEIARQRKPAPETIPPAYLKPILEELLNPKAPVESWWTSDKATAAEGERRGVKPKLGESMEAFRDRIRQAPRDGGRAAA